MEQAPEHQIKVTKSGKIRNWFTKNASKPIAEKILYLISFVDSFISPMPPDPFLAILTVLNPKKWFRYAVGTALFGVLGGLIGYIIGYVFFELIGEQLVALYNVETGLQSLGTALDENAFMSIFIAAFTPIPYQIFTVAAGLFKINIVVFVVASILGRLLRFTIVALIMHLVGEKFGKLILKYLNYVLLVMGLALVVYILFL